MNWFKEDWGCAGNAVQSPCFCVSLCSFASFPPFHTSASGLSAQVEGMVCHIQNRNSCYQFKFPVEMNLPVSDAQLWPSQLKLEVDRTGRYGHWDPGRVMVVWVEPLKMTTSHPST